MLRKFATIAETNRNFVWDVPEFFNIGVDICDRPAKSVPQATAIVDIDSTGQPTAYCFAQLQEMSARMAGLISRRAAPGDRIAVLLPQRVETALAFIASAKAGCISIPLFTQFGPDALLHRLQDSGARMVITDFEGAESLRRIRGDLPELQHVFCADGPAAGAEDLHTAMRALSSDFVPVQTRAEDSALLIYTSGTTGPPKGALHAHRVLLGHLPGVEMSHDFFPQPDDKIWTPADWAWIGGLLDVLMPALHHGVPVVACRFRKFTAEAAFALIKDHSVRNAFLPPTALKLMRKSSPPGQLSMRSVASGGETLGKELIEWGRKVFGVTINEFYGQTECNMIVSSCTALAPAEPGVMGFPVPGHRLEILNEDQDRCCQVDEVGSIAVRAPDPVMFLKYWNNSRATEEKFVTIKGHKYLLTGDKGNWTESGRIRFVGRGDDIINSGGYRIGPSEIEDCLLSHEAVHLAGVVGKPDDLRGSVVTAFIQLSEGYAPSRRLADDISDYVKSRLAAYEYPRVVRFVEEMPMTTTGKIIRSRLRELVIDEAPET